MSSVINRETKGLSSAVDRLIAALCDPARENKAAILFLSIYSCLWYVYWVVSRSSRDMHPDIAEMLVWSRELALGYPKHPPLPAGILWAWFAVFPVTDWAYTLLAVLNIALGLYFAFRLSAQWLDGEKRAAALLLLAVIPFYNFLGFKFDQNSLLIPLWALSMWALVRALDTRGFGWAILCGVAAAGAMLTKYWSVFLLLAMAATALSDPRRRSYFRSAAPYVTAATFLILTTPHLVWLIQNHFPPLTWIGARRSADTFAFWLRSFLSYTLGTFAYSLPALVLYGLGTRPSGAAIRDSLWPSDPVRRRAAILFWVPLIAPLAVAIVRAMQLVSLWNIPALNLLPVLLLSSPRISLPRFSVKVMAIVALGLPLVMLLAAPGVAYYKVRYGTENYGLYARLAGEVLAAEWKTSTTAPLRIVAGPFGLASTAAAYLPERPATFADFSRYLSPWIDQQRIDRQGMAIVTPAGDAHWLAQAEKYSGAIPFKEVVIRRKWLWWQSAPRRFLIAIVPPKQAQ